MTPLVQILIGMLILSFGVNGLLLIFLQSTMHRVKCLEQTCDEQEGEILDLIYRKKNKPL